MCSVMNIQSLPPREQFRLLGQQIMRCPTDIALHKQRIEQSLSMAGAEPLQGVLADMLYAVAGEKETEDWINQPNVANRLPILLHQRFLKQLASKRRLPRVSALATRWSVLVTPSLDVPARAILCGSDDSRALAAEAIAAILVGVEDAEIEFLAHCEGANDTLAFMLVRRALIKEGKTLSPHWDSMMMTLQKRSLV